MREIKRKIKRIASILLCAGLAFTTVACRGDGPNSSASSSSKEESSSSASTSSTSSSEASSDSVESSSELLDSSVDSSVDDSSSSDEIEEIEIKGTIHEREITETSEKLVEGGATNYKIVLPVAADANEKKAAGQLNYFFNEATGLTLAELADNTVGWADSERFISIGDTSLLSGAGIAADKSDLKGSGFYIQTVGKSIFIYGGEDYGVNYGVFELVSYLFDMDYYAADVYTIDRNVTELPLYDFAVKEVPDFETREAFSGLNKLSGDENYLLATRQTTEAKYKGNSASSSTTGDSQNVHNALLFVDPKQIDPETVGTAEEKTYFETHRNWFSEQLTGESSPLQPCYSRDPEGLIAAVTAQMKVSVLEHKDTSMFLYGSMDVAQVCECDSCDAVRAEYGCNSASYIQIVNGIAKNIDAWWKSNELTPEEKNGRREIKIGLLAYHEQQDAPVTFNEKTGKWEALGEEFKLADNVFVQMALIESFRNVPYTDAQNQTEYEILQKWQVLCDETMIWAYNTMFQNYLVFADTFNAMQSDYQTLYAYGTQHLYDQGVFNVATATGFNTLKVYLQGKLGWDIQSDYGYYIDKWFDGYFEEAAAPMRKYFDAMRGKTQEWIAKGLIKRGVEGNDYCTTELYGENPGYIDSMLTYFDEAYEVIEPLKTTNPEKYGKLYERILLESISPRYVHLELYSTEVYMSAERAQEMRMQFKSDCERVGLDRFSEHVMLSTLWTRWGL